MTFRMMRCWGFGLCVLAGLVPGAIAGPISPAESLKQIQLIDGFGIDLFAQEPQIMDPVEMAFDENGRVYVIEMRGFQLGEKGQGAKGLGRVKLLEDTDWDGHADKVTIFLDKLTYATAITPWRGGILLGVAPDLLFAKDTDGDGVADVKKVYYTGFGTANHEQLINDLQWGFDNMLYGCSGGNGGNITSPIDPSMKATSVRGRDFRFRPDKKLFETISGGGQFGMTIDEAGNRFTCTNSSHLIHYVVEDPYLQRNPYQAVRSTRSTPPDHGAAAKVHRISPFEKWRDIRTKRRAADPNFRKRLPPTELVPGGFFTAACSVTYYNGDSFPPEFHGQIFVEDVSNNIIHRDRLEPKGATFVAHICDKDSEFLASKDNWFRPTGLLVGPDGDLYIVDFYRNIIETPASIPDDILADIDMNAGNDLGRIYRVFPTSQTKRRRPALGRASIAQLVKTLEDKNGWWRDTAHRLLVERNDTEAVGHLKKLLTATKNPVTKIHALWLLEEFGALKEAMLVTAFGDTSPLVREQAIRLSEPRLLRSGRLVKQLVRLADDSDPAVRFQLALSIGYASAEAAGEILAKISERDANDSWMRLAIVSSAREAAYTLLGTLTDGPFVIKATAGRKALLGELAATVGGSQNTEQIASLIKRAAAYRDEKQAWPVSMLRGLASGLQRARSRSLDLSSAQADLMALLSESHPAIRLAAFQVAKAVKLRPAPALTNLIKRAVDEAGDSEKTVTQRTAAVELLALASFKDIRKNMEELLGFRQPKEVQITAVKTLGSFSEKEVADVLIGSMRGLSPQVRKEAIAVIFSRSDRLPALLTAIEEGDLAPWTIDAQQRERLTNHANEKIRTRAKQVFQDTKRADREKVYERYRAAVAKLEGNPERGKKVFLDNCAQCHKLMGMGTQVGADLKGVKDRLPEAILMDILVPSKAIVAGFENYVIETEDGELLTGIIASETAGSITLRRAKGEESVVLRDNIEMMYAGKLSIMPEEMETSINPQQMADLIRFIRTQK